MPSCADCKHRESPERASLGPIHSKCRANPYPHGLDLQLCVEVNAHGDCPKREAKEERRA